MISAIVQIVLLYLFVYFASHSLDLSVLPFGLFEENQRNSLFVQLINSFEGFSNIRQLHLIFIFGWLAVFWLTRIILSRSFESILATAITLMLMPAYMASGVIHPSLFVWVSALLIINLRYLNANAILCIVGMFLSVIVSAAMSNAYALLIVPIVFMAVNNQHKSALLFIGGMLFSFAPFLFDSNPLGAFFYGWKFPGKFLSDIFRLDVKSFLAISFLLMLTYRLILDKNNYRNRNWLYPILTVVGFFICDFYFELSLLMLILLFSDKQFSLNGSRYVRIKVVGLFLLFPPIATITFNSTIGGSSWQLGIDPKFEELYEVSKRIEFEGRIYNNEWTSTELSFFFPQGEPFAGENRFNDSLEDIFEQNTQDVISWINFRTSRDIKMIYFNLNNERQRHLEFLGQRLMDGEWVLIAQEKEQYALLVRREDQFKGVIQRYSIDPTLQ